MRALCNVALAALCAAFLHSHLVVGQETGRWHVVLPIVVLESLWIVLFLVRRPSVAVSRRPVDWALAFSGWVLPLLLRPTDELGPLAGIGEPLQVGGVLLVLLGTASLRRSVGLVAANRGVVSIGIYRLVRHPMYAGYIAAGVGYVASFPTVWNLAIAAASAVVVLFRSAVEERFLAADPHYRAYARRVPWRFVPRLY